MTMRVSQGGVFFPGRGVDWGLTLRHRKMIVTIPTTMKETRTNLRVAPVAVQERYLKAAVAVDLKVIKATNIPALTIYPVLICFKMLLKIVIKKQDPRRDPRTMTSEKKLKTAREAEWSHLGNLLPD